MNDSHSYFNFPSDFAAMHRHNSKDLSRRQSEVDNPRTQEASRYPEARKTQPLGEFPVLLSGADAKRLGRLCRWCYSIGERGEKGRIAPAGCEITLIPIASFVSASLLPPSMVNGYFLHHCLVNI